MASEASAMRQHPLFGLFSEAAGCCLLHSAIWLLILCGLVRFVFSGSYANSLVPALICLGVGAMFFCYGSCFYSNASRTFRDMASPPIAISGRLRSRRIVGDC